jgi:hypothetical protein
MALINTFARDLIFALSEFVERLALRKTRSRRLEQTSRGAYTWAVDLACLKKQQQNPDPSR